MTVMHVLTLILTLALQSTTAGFTPDQLWQSWPDERFVQIPAPCLRPAELTAELERLAALYPEKIELEEAGRSFDQRPVHLVTLGRGSQTVLLWSQMHGDEPSATPALLDIANFLLSHSEEPEAAAILDGLTLLMVPMLNPDGAEIYQRRNLQAIDINRDALNLATPEGRILKKIRDQYEPMLGFNLHDQNRRTAVGDTGVLATNAVLAVSGDEAGTITPGRLRAKRACAAIVEALAPYMPGGMARYDEDWSPRSFGDNITAWGTPVVLIESGGLPPGRGFEDLTRLNFVAILTVLQELVRDDLKDYDPDVYNNLLRNESDAWADVVVRGGLIRQPGFASPYRADLAFNFEVDDRDAAGCATGNAGYSRLVEIGDARFLGAGRVVDADESLLLVPFVAGVEGWKARRWLDSEVLAEVARLGVGTVVWEVPRRKIEAAEALALKLAGEGRARLEVVPQPAQMPWLILTDPPLPPASDSLIDVVQALVGGREQVDSVNSETLELLAGVPHSSPHSATLRRGRPASFLLLSPTTEGKIDAEAARLSSVFIDGLEVLGGSQ
jgi:hypothetical protein